MPPLLSTARTMPRHSTSKTKAAFDPEEKPIARDLLPNVSSFPDCGMDEVAVENTEFDYSIRAKEDWVIDGPLGVETEEAAVAGKFRNQRWFETWEDAEVWARKTYGKRLKCRKPSEPGDLRRWAFIIRGPRG